MKTDNNETYFNKREIAAAIQLWNRAAISLLDIRHNLIAPEEAVRNYRLPASTFLYTKGETEILLDDTVYHTERFGLFHGGKGTELSIQPQSNWLEYYMVLYKTGEPPFQKREYVKLMEQANPFRQQYGFSPANPLLFEDHLKKMFERWKGPTPLNLFYGKAVFYQFVYEVYEELEKNHARILEPDVVSMAVRFLEANYREDISIQEMSAMLGISYSHFHRLFKRKTEKTPQEYLIDTRLNEARKHLRNSNASVREIAERCGFIDESSFYRLFMKNEGQSPGLYREVSQWLRRDFTIEKVHAFPYNLESQVSNDKLKGKGATFMFKQMKSKAVVAAALSLMLLMSACGTAPATSTGDNTTPTSAVTSQAPETEAAEPEGEGMKTVETIRGYVEIPQNPQKVVVLNYGFGDILALGVTPAAVNDYWAIAGSAVEGLLKDIPRASELEEILSIEPDLILTAYEKDEAYEKLSKIAPTVSFGTAKDTTQQTLEERLTFLSEVLGVDEAVKTRVLSNYYAHIEQAKQKLTDAGYSDKAFTIISNSLDEPGIVVSSYKGAHALYDELGMLRSEKGQEIYESGEWYANLSLEVLPEYCGDYIIIYYGDEGKNVFSGNGVYENIEAVKNGNVILMDEYLSTFNDVISVTSQVDFIVEQLLSVDN